MDFIGEGSIDQAARTDLDGVSAEDRTAMLHSIEKMAKSVIDLFGYRLRVSEETMEFFRKLGVDTDLFKLEDAETRWKG